jgi:hypothetical protein
MDDFAYAPIACSIFTAVSRMRGADISRFSEGALAIENVRTFLSSRFPGGFTNVRSEGCPGLRSNPDGFRTATPM